MSTVAGKGNNHLFILTTPPNKAKGEPTASRLQRETDYVRVDAVTWYVNRQGNFFKKRMVAGTLHFAINGQELSTVLGTYELKDGQKTAPVFDQPVVPWVAYQGGDLMLRAYIRGTSQNTEAGSLLSKMAVASLTVVAGAIQAETGGLAATALLAAGGTLTDGAISMLSSNTPRTVSIFDPFQVNIDLTSKMKGTEIYVLLHRGDDTIRESQLSIRTTAATPEIRRNNSFLDDGAWILFRIRKSDVYDGPPRPWADEAESAKNAIETLIQQWETNSQDVQSVAAALVPSGKEPANVGDKYISVCRRIRADAVLTPQDRFANVGGVRTFYEAAQAAVKAKDPKVFRQLLSQTRQNLAQGVAPPHKIALLYREEALSLKPLRGIRTVADLGKKGMWKSLTI